MGWGIVAKSIPLRSSERGPINSLFTEVPANLTLQKSLEISLVLSSSLPHHQEQSLYPPFLGSVLSMGPLGAVDTLLSITQLICEAELGPRGNSLSNQAAAAE